MASAKENDQDGARTALARRRGHGEGAIYRDDARGRWVGQIDLGLGLNGKRRRPKVFGRTKTEVRARLDEIRHSQATGLPIASGDRLGEHLDWWLANLEAKAATRAPTRSTMPGGPSRRGSSRRSAAGECATSNPRTSRDCSPGWRRRGRTGPSVNRRSVLSRSGVRRGGASREGRP